MFDFTPGPNSGRFSAAPAACGVAEGAGVGCGRQCNCQADHQRLPQRPLVCLWTYVKASTQRRAVRFGSVGKVQVGMQPEVREGDLKHHKVQHLAAAGGWNRWGWVLGSSCVLAGCRVGVQGCTLRWCAAPPHSASTRRTPHAADTQTTTCTRRGRGWEAHQIRERMFTESP
jgi:hypothetical protein